MTKRLEEEFNLPSMDEVANMGTVEVDPENPIATIQHVEDAISISEKINSALSAVHGMESHDSEMDDIARQALDSYAQLMALGMNMTDMAAGPVFANAATMLKIALDAKDSKVTRKLKQVDLMLKKARLDKQNGIQDDGTAGTQLDRNELLKLINQKDK